MTPPHFHLEFVEALAQHRNPALTLLFQFASGIGSIDFYVLLILFIYVARNKSLGVRMSYLIMATMAANDLLKNLIHNPRPFVSEGTYRHWWAVSPAQAESLAAEYSTPSGHAMAAGSFYSYLYIAVRRGWVRALSVVLILLIGFSRPYLGVHYGEDILLGWACGIGMALLIARYTETIAGYWSRRSYPAQIAFAFFGSMALVAANVAFKGGEIDTQLQGMVTCAGFATGAVIAFPLEQRWVCFNPRTGNHAIKALRCFAAVITVSSIAVSIRVVIAFAGLGTSHWRFVLIYLGYAVAGLVGMYLTPALLLHLGLLEREVDRGSFEGANSDRTLRKKFWSHEPL